MLEREEISMKRLKAPQKLTRKQKIEYTEKRGQSSDKKDTSWNQEKE